MKNYNKYKELSHLQCWSVNNLCGWAMSQKFQVNNFEWIEGTSQFNEYFIKKTIFKKVIKGIFLKLMFSILKNYLYFMKIYHFYLM